MDFLAWLLGQQPQVQEPRTDIELPYEGSWGHVPQDIRIAIQRGAEDNGIDVDQLFRQVRTESNFQPNARNGKVQGLMQLSPLIQKAYGVKDPLDPMDNVRAGAEYLKHLIDKYDGNMKLALAAYNAGPTAVKRAGGVPKFKETQDYVRKILRK